MNYYLAVLKKYAIFDGRAQRAEYWYFVLFNVIVMFLLSMLDTVLGISADPEDGILSGIYQLAVLIPSIAVGIRRMHDVNKSGWFILIPIYNFILAVTDGTPGDNRYGQNPKGQVSPVSAPSSEPVQVPAPEPTPEPTQTSQPVDPNVSQGENSNEEPRA